MLTPIPFSTNSNASTDGVTNQVNNSTAPSGRRRGSSFNMILNTFGIRHASNNNSNSANNSTSNLTQSMSNGNNTSINDGNAISQENSHINSNNSNEFYQLPISLSLTSNDVSNNMASNQGEPLFNTNHNSTSGTNLITNTHTVTNNTLELTDENQNGDSNDIRNNNDNNPNTNDILRNLRHFIYGADQQNPDSLLHLDLPQNGRELEVCTSDSIRRRKDKNGLFSIRLTPFIDNSNSSNPGLYFDPVIRTAGPGSQLVIGRYTERVREAISKVPENYHPVVFKSKVVSRTHGCLKVDSKGNWYVKDVKSSSGTFLNHQRLSPASTLSKDTLLHDGDVLQLGMDFRGGTEEIYRCVKMRVELNKSWKRKANAFNKEALQRIRNLQKLTSGFEEEDCSICLSAIKPCQAIFISPCSHSWHFHCIRRLVMLSYPQFVCPNCRSSCDLEASFESSDDESEMMIDDDVDNDDNTNEFADLRSGINNDEMDINEGNLTSTSTDDAEIESNDSTD